MQRRPVAVAGLTRPQTGEPQRRRMFRVEGENSRDQVVEFTATIGAANERDLAYDLSFKQGINTTQNSVTLKR